MSFWETLLFTWIGGCFVSLTIVAAAFLSGVVNRRRK